VGVKTVRPVHSDGVNFVLPAKEREELGLELGDTPEYWVRPADESVSNEKRDPTQVDLSDVVDSEEDVEHVLLFNSTGRTLHATKGDDETVCGKEIDSAQGYANVDGPDNVGGEFSECQRCAQYETGFRSQPECRRFLSERIDGIKYDEGDSTPGYLTKNEMPALVGYIEELEQQVAGAG
jgi:bifunctional DNA-binding transcriptional regulator/antitoxin component of YhaV-PrlF toxin-antitoxin module